MAKLRSTTKQIIFDTLENTYFTASSFEIKYYENRKEFLEITFIPQKAFSFKASKNSSYSSRSNWITSEAPGLHLSESENFSINNFDSIVEHLSEWANRILEDYRYGKKDEFDEFEDFQKQVDAKVEETSDDENQSFSKDEANQLKEKLDSLYRKFESLSEENDELKSQLTSIKTEIESLKGDVEHFPKKAWYQITGNKIVKLMKKVATTPEGRKLIAETAKKYLIGG